MTSSIINLILISSVLIIFLLILHHPKIRARLHSKMPVSKISVQETKWTNVGTISIIQVHGQRFLIVQNKSAISVTPLEEKTEEKTEEKQPIQKE